MHADEQQQIREAIKEISDAITSFEKAITPIFDSKEYEVKYLSDMADLSSKLRKLKIELNNLD